MKVMLFAIFDVKSGVYLAPFPARSAVDAMRNIKDGMRNPQMKETPIAQNPEDFALYKLGDFEDESGEISPCAPLLVARVHDLVAQATPGTVPS